MCSYLVYQTLNMIFSVLHTRDWEPMNITLQALSFVGKVEPVRVRFTLRLRDQRSMWMQDGCKVYVDSYMALNIPCFMVTCIIFKNYLLEVGLTGESTALWTLTTVDLFYFIMCEDPQPRMNRRSLKLAFGWGASHTWLHTILEGPWPHYMILEVSWDGLGHFILGSQSHGHNSWLVYEVALSVMLHYLQRVKSKCIEISKCHHLLIANMLLIINRKYFLKWSFTHIMTFGVAHWDTWDDSFA